jgi:hypothetical protein
LRAALDPATDDLLFDIVINRCGARAHRRPPAAPLRIRAPESITAAGADADGFASVLPYVLPMRSAEKSENSSRINRVTLSPMESEFFVFYFKLQK